MAPARPELDEQLATILNALQFCFVLADCREPDNPITYASSGFYDLTGYSPDEVIGRNCRFLQGPETSRQKVMEMRDAIREERTCEVCLINYKQSGDKFWNQFYLSPVMDNNNCVSYYVGIQSDVSHLMPQDGALHTEYDTSNVESDGSCHQAQFPDVVHEERQKADGVNHVLQDWSSTKGAHRQGIRRSLDCRRGPASDLPSSLLVPLMKLQRSFVLSDPNQPDCPIVHASTDFLLMTGYPRDAVVGRNCRFLQGPQTDNAEVKRLRDAMTADPPRPITVKLLNYKIDGQPFWNNLHVAPIRSACGEVIFFVGVQLDLTASPLPQAAAAAQHLQLAPGHQVASTEPADAAPPDGSGEHAGLQRDALVSPAAAQQVQSQIMDSDLGRTHQSDSQPAEECGQLSGVRQLLKCSSAPAGGHTAAGVAMSLGNLHPRLHVHPGQRLKDVPECGQATIEHRMDQKGVVGAVRVACRSLCSRGLRRSLEDQASPRHLLLERRSTDACRRQSLHMRQTL
ncbi:hypothetical protein ABBQ38_010559 [Trebouxia sp. C0009 RCD-2024]